MEKELHLIKMEKGEKIDESLGFKSTSPFAPLIPAIVALSPYVFLIVLQGDWTKKEIRNASNRIAFDIAEIDDIIDVVVQIDNCIEFDVAFHANNVSPEIEFQHVESGKGIAFYITFIDCETKILHQRLCSLNDEQSNEFIDILLEQRKKGMTKEEYSRKVNKLYDEMSMEEIKANSFIHQNYFYRR